MVFPHTGSSESVKGLGAGLTIEQLVINATGDWKEISYQVARELVPAMQRAAAEHYGSV
jgi:hypothetical protein